MIRTYLLVREPESLRTSHQVVHNRTALLAGDDDVLRGEPKRITEADRVAAGVGIQIDPARQPDGILRQEAPMLGPPNEARILSQLFAPILETAIPLAADT